jgi:hypothetical protein
MVAEWTSPLTTPFSFSSPAPTTDLKQIDSIYNSKQTFLRKPHPVETFYVKQVLRMKKTASELQIPTLQLENRAEGCSLSGKCHHIPPEKQIVHLISESD